MVIIRVIVVVEDLKCVPINRAAYAQHNLISSRHCLDSKTFFAAGLDKTPKFQLVRRLLGLAGLRFNLTEVLRAIAAIEMMGYYKHWPCPNYVLQQIHRSQQAEYVDHQSLQIAGSIVRVQLPM